MKKVDSILLKVFLYGLPGVVVLAVVSYFFLENAVHPSAGAKMLNAFSGLVFAVWLVLCLYVCVRLLVSEQFRDKVLAKLTFMKERDEREVVLTGRAARTTFLTSLAILIFLLFLSCFQVSLYRVPPEKAVDGKTGMATISFTVKLLEDTQRNNENGTSQNYNLFSYVGLPLTGTAVILLLIVWQIGSYNYSMRRLTKMTVGSHR